MSKSKNIWFKVSNVLDVTPEILGDKSSLAAVATAEQKALLRGTTRFLCYVFVIKTGALSFFRLAPFQRSTFKISYLGIWRQ